MLATELMLKREAHLSSFLLGTRTRNSRAYLTITFFCSPAMDKTFACCPPRPPSVPFWFVPQEISQPSWIGYCPPGLAKPSAKLAHLKNKLHCSCLIRKCKEVLWLESCNVHRSTTRSEILVSQTKARFHIVALPNMLILPVDMKLCQMISK